jgi:hypothetical protein
MHQVKLVNISNNDIVDGNPKLTLGLVWSIILHWQVCTFIVKPIELSAIIVVLINMINEFRALKSVEKNNLYSCAKLFSCRNRLCPKIGSLCK